MKKGLKLSSPWAIYFRQIQALFKKDPEIKVFFDEEEVKLKIYVDNSAKAAALTEFLPTEKEFGNVVMNIEVIPGNKKVECGPPIQDIFKGNEAVSDIVVSENIFSFLTYVVFKKEVVQYFNDDLSDLHGVCSTLYQDIAKEIFGNIKGVFFCTALDEGKGFKAPLGEWP